jgi:cobalt-zinc-cadmium efflux system outer membrane protein
LEIVMSVRHLLACVPLLFGAIPGTLDAQARPLSLEQALSEAREKSLEIRLAEADLAVARADLRTARLLTYNPEAGFSIGPSSNSDTTLTSYQLGISQTLELGGKRGHRRVAAERRVEAAEARLARSRELVFGRVRRAFGLALVAEARVATALEADSVATLLRSAAEERLRLGAGTQLEINVASAAAARERRARLQAERELTSARLELSTAIGLPPSEAITPEGEIPTAIAPTRSEDELVQLALERRPDLAGFRAEVAAAESERRLAGALGWPDPTIGVSGGQEEDFQVLRFGLAFPLPLWNRGQGARAQAGAALDRARLAEAVARREAEREVRDSYRALAQAIAAERAFDREAVERLRENLALAEESFRAGKIGLLIFNSVRRDLVEARLDYLDAVGEVIERSAALALAVGGDIGSNQ